MEVESTDLHAPAGSGTRASFLIHSPARALCVGGTADSLLTSGGFHWINESPFGR
jgi:hypothetical protein